jgi:hypothetical protein
MGRGSKYHGHRGRYTMGRGSIYHGNGVDIPWVMGQNTMDSGVKILWEGIKISWVGGQYNMGRVPKPRHRLLLLMTI